MDTQPHDHQTFYCDLLISIILCIKTHTQDGGHCPPK